MDFDEPGMTPQQRDLAIIVKRIQDYSWVYVNKTFPDFKILIANGLTKKDIIESGFLFEVNILFLALKVLKETLEDEAGFTAKELKKYLSHS